MEMKCVAIENFSMYFLWMAMGFGRLLWMIILAFVFVAHVMYMWRLFWLWYLLLWWCSVVYCCYLWFQVLFCFGSGSMMCNKRVFWLSFGAALYRVLVSLLWSFVLDFLVYVHFVVCYCFGFYVVVLVAACCILVLYFCFLMANNIYIYI
jgi:hypothetical protein